MSNFNGTSIGSSQIPVYIHAPSNCLFVVDGATRQQYWVVDYQTGQPMVNRQLFMDPGTGNLFAASLTGAGYVWLINPVTGQHLARPVQPHENGPEVQQSAQQPEQLEKQSMNHQQIDWQGCNQALPMQQSRGMGQQEASVKETRIEQTKARQQFQPQQQVLLQGQQTQPNPSYEQLDQQQAQVYEQPCRQQMQAQQEQVQPSQQQSPTKQDAQVFQQPLQQQLPAQLGEHELQQSFQQQACNDAVLQEAQQIQSQPQQEHQVLSQVQPYQEIQSQFHLDQNGLSAVQDAQQVNLQTQSDAQVQMQVQTNQQALIGDSDMYLAQQQGEDVPEVHQNQASSEEAQDEHAGQDADGNQDSNNSKVGIPGLAVTSLALGAIAVAISFFPLVNQGSIILGLVGLAFAIAGIAATRNGKKKGRGLAAVGLALGVIAIVIALVMQGYFANVFNSSNGNMQQGSTSAVTSSQSNANDTGGLVSSEASGESTMIENDSDSRESTSGDIVASDESSVLGNGVEGSFTTNGDTLSVGESATLENGLTIIVVDIQSGFEGYGGNTLTGVTVSYVNDGSSSISISPNDWKGQTESGALKHPTAFSKSDDVLERAELTSGSEITGTVYFVGDIVKVYCHMSGSSQDDPGLAWAA